jgi:hypothetical protein
MFICLLKIKTFGHVINYSNTISHYDIISDIDFYHLSYVCELDPSTHMRCIRFLSKIGCDIGSVCFLSPSWERRNSGFTRIRKQSTLEQIFRGVPRKNP